MIRSKRLAEMEKYIIEKSHVKIEDISEKFGISISSVRRDINEIEKNGKIKKVYGGVKSIEKINPLLSYDSRNQKNSESKLIIAQLAAQFIESKDTIFIDSGTTTVNIPDYIPEDVKDVIIVTNNVALLKNHAENVNNNITIISLPGKYDPNTNSIIGIGTIKYMDIYNFSKVFMSATAVSSDGDITNSSVDEYYIKKKAISKGKEKFLLVNSDKINKYAFLSYSNLSEIDYLVTEKPVYEFMDKFENVKFIYKD